MAEAGREYAARAVCEVERENQAPVAKVEEVGNAVGFRLTLEIGNRAFVIGRDFEFTSLVRH